MAQDLVRKLCVKGEIPFLLETRCPVLEPVLVRTVDKAFPTKTVPPKKFVLFSVSKGKDWGTPRGEEKGRRGMLFRPPEQRAK